MGLKIKLGKYVNHSFGHNAATAEQRASDINFFFEDNEVKAIISTTGGWNSNAVLPYLDFDLIKNNPKIFCGFSDITALNLAIYEKTRIKTFNGPTLLPTFGEFEGPFDFSLKSFKDNLFSKEIIGEISFPDEFSEESLWWDKDDNRKRILKKSQGLKCVKKGKVEGILIGGNLVTLCILAGTQYFPNFENSILFLEDQGESTASTERNLEFLSQLGVFSKVKGLIYGKPSNLYQSSPERSLYDILSDIGKKYEIPILADVDIGHTNPILTFPIGIKIELDSTNKKITFKESPFAE